MSRSHLIAGWNATNCSSKSSRDHLLDIGHDVIPALSTPVEYPLSPGGIKRSRKIKEASYLPSQGHRRPEDQQYARDRMREQTQDSWGNTKCKRTLHAGVSKSLQSSLRNLAPAPSMDRKQRQERRLNPLMPD
ncbi:hypothetical protein CEXT_4951 [Caerostris extrusa]|uniref:Uncharacterized protein n=1 Tax=Caerostris extrusa TaxID=172846 RepID=A0AAV4WCR9_CAEEX|nr:hypothetical protein CEXT_4951 [Caerostris extrusa]